MYSPLTVGFVCNQERDTDAAASSPSHVNDTWKEQRDGARTGQVLHLELQAWLRQPLQPGACQQQRGQNQAGQVSDCLGRQNFSQAGLNHQIDSDYYNRIRST